MEMALEEGEGGGLNAGGGSGWSGGGGVGEVKHLGEGKGPIV